MIILSRVVSCMQAINKLFLHCEKQSIANWQCRKQDAECESLEKYQCAGLLLTRNSIVLKDLLQNDKDFKRPH